MTDIHPDGSAITHLLRMDIETGKMEDLGALYDPDLDQSVWYVSRAMWISPNDLIGAVVGRTPTGVVHIHFDEGEIKNNNDQSFNKMRLWG